MSEASSERAEIIAIGDELVHGLTVDTNSAFLARELENLGVSVVRVTVVRDEPDELRDVIAGAANRSRIVLLTGGLGPTEDDRTRSACAEAAGVELRFDEACWRNIEAWFRRIRRSEVPVSNRRQAELPVGAVAIDNDVGTAPGFVLQIGQAHVFAMPGVPCEMKLMFARAVGPMVRDALGLFGPPAGDSRTALVGSRRSGLG